LIFAFWPEQTWSPVVASKNDRWTKWWWIAYFGLERWTAVERSVRISLGMTALVVVLVIYFMIVGIFALIGIDPHYGSPIAAAIAIAPGFLAARPIAMVFFAESLQKADENSQRRLRAP
jgi:hypothetical protein